MVEYLITRNQQLCDLHQCQSYCGFTLTTVLSLVPTGLSPGEIAGIVIGVLVLLVAAAVGVIFYKKKGQVCKYYR